MDSDRAKNLRASRRVLACVQELVAQDPDLQGAGVTVILHDAHVVVGGGNVALVSTLTDRAESRIVLCNALQGSLEADGFSLVEDPERAMDELRAHMEPKQQH